MDLSRLSPPLPRNGTGLRPATKHSLIVIGVCVACLALVFSLGNMVGAPTNRAQAEALATGG